MRLSAFFLFSAAFILSCSSGLAQTTKYYEAELANLKAEISNKQSEIQRLETEIKSREILIKGYGKVEKMGEELLQKEVLERQKYESMVKMDPAYAMSCEIIIKSDMDKYFSEYIEQNRAANKSFAPKGGPIYISENISLKNYTDLKAFIVSQRSEVKMARESLDLLKDDLKLQKGMLQKMQQKFARKNTVLYWIKCRDALEGQWQPIGNDSVVIVSFDTKTKKFIGTLIKDNFKCYKKHDIMFEVSPQENTTNTFKGAEFGFSDYETCKKRNTPLTLTITGSHMSYHNQGKTMPWTKIAEPPSRWDNDSDFEKEMFGGF